MGKRTYNNRTHAERVLAAREERSKNQNQNGDGNSGDR
jgi:hypothetical protein